MKQINKLIIISTMSVLFSTQTIAWVDWNNVESEVIQDAIVMDTKPEVIQPDAIQPDAIEIGCN